MKGPLPEMRVLVWLVISGSLPFGGGTPTVIGVGAYFGSGSGFIATSITIW
jgi:hypothetical protein